MECFDTVVLGLIGIFIYYKSFTEDITKIGLIDIFICYGSFTNNHTTILLQQCRIDPVKYDVKLYTSAKINNLFSICNQASTWTET